MVGRRAGHRPSNASIVPQLVEDSDGGSVPAHTQGGPLLVDARVGVTVTTALSRDKSLGALINPSHVIHPRCFIFLSIKLHSNGTTGRISVYYNNGI